MQVQQWQGTGGIPSADDDVGCVAGEAGADLVVGGVADKWSDVGGNCAVKHVETFVLNSGTTEVKKTELGGGEWCAFGTGLEMKYSEQCVLSERRPHACKHNIPPPCGCAPL